MQAPPAPTVKGMAGTEGVDPQLLALADQWLANGRMFLAKLDRDYWERAQHCSTEEIFAALLAWFAEMNWQPQELISVLAAAVVERYRAPLTIDGICGIDG